MDGWAADRAAPPAGPGSALAGLAFHLVLDLGFGDRLAPEHVPGAGSRAQHPGDERVDDPVVPHVRDARAFAEAVGRPAARVVILRGGPDDRDEDHDDGPGSGADPEAAPALDLPDRLLAGGLLAAGRSAGAAAWRCVVGDVMEHRDHFLRKRDIRVGPVAQIAPYLQTEPPDQEGSEALGPMLRDVSLHKANYCLRKGKGFVKPT